ncbi:p115 like vesicle tethering protein [Radiomyces spectabilis]|uniref:p115 like vesicle tethering protein n=1 Tax=Radiomyces spectabilis TaxID=64574 RepID=UPI00221F690C|nr:p115 like vesicle tethering protein [Radiomyces spectabilis]KAI8368110.1 p115 like vesicle tethering protein [Radiomyces spectabilis]
MDFFTRGYSALRGEKGQPQSADETIEKLADCLETATLLEDRRAGVLSLKGLARDWTEQVGDKSLPALVKVLHTDYRDADIVKSLLETLTILCTVQNQNSASDIGYKFTDYFIEDSTNVTILLDVLEEFDFYVRFNTIKLLSTLLINREKRIQECILTSPMGITRLVDLLDDKREIIRNEGLLLLIALTRSNTEVQKLVTFQATFEKLLAIIEEQEGISGDIVVQDSLTLMHNLLRYNVSDQIYFRETSCIQQIPGLLGYVGDSEADHVPYSFEDWPPQKVANTVLVLELIRILAEPEGANTPANQKVMVQSGILLPIVQLGICSNAPSLVRAEALYAIGYVLRANAVNQDIFSQIMVASPPKIIDGQIDPQTASGIPRPAMVSLIAIALNTDTDSQYSYSSRAAAAYAVSSCIEENKDAQIVLAATMKSPPEDNVNTQFADKPHSAGSLLLEVIDNWELSVKDPYKVWFACTILSHIIRNNEEAKQVAGAIVFGEEEQGKSSFWGEEPVPLLHHITAQLLMCTKSQGINARIPIAYLCLLSIWLYDSPNSVSLFLSESTHIQFLIQEVQSSANDPIVQGLAAFFRVDQFNSHLARLRDSSAVKNAPQYLQISAEEEYISQSTHSLPSLLLDSTFVEFFKDTYETVQRSIKKKPASFQTQKATAAASVDPASEKLIEEYKHTIANQSNDIKALEQKVAQLEQSLANSVSLCRVCCIFFNLVYMLLTFTTQDEDWKKKLADSESSVAAEKKKFVDLEREQEDLLICMGGQDLEIKKYRQRVRDLGGTVTDTEDEDEEEE